MQRVCKYLLLLAVVVATSLIIWDSKVYAVDSWTGTINGTGVNFRTGPGTSYDSLGKVNKGDNGVILEEAKDDGGSSWYKMIINNKEGWVYASYVDAKVTSVDFKEYLTRQGFPESYHDGLIALHAKYPNWIFEAQHTNLTWDEVITAECKLGRNLVDIDSISSWKSTAHEEAYNWETGVWTGYDGGSWAAASEAIIKYHMDPRNFLDDNYIFQFLRQSYDPTMDYAPSLTAMFAPSSFWSSSFEEEGQMKNYVQSVIEAGAISEVSPYTIASTIIQEQGWAPSSDLISGRSGVYNFFNVGAYEDDTMGPVERGVWYAGLTDAETLRPWNTRTKAIAGGALIFGKSYIKKGQDTLYLKKFDVVDEGGLYNHQYMTHVLAAASEGKLLAKAFWDESAAESTRTSSLIFKIPVYKNMPETPCVKPTGTGSPNNKLSSLGINGYSLTPTFNKDTQEYALIVPYAVSEITVSASAHDSKAAISGTGRVALAVGKNIINVEVKAENGDVRTYTLEVIRSEVNNMAPNVLTSSVYNVDPGSMLLSGITQTSISVEDFKKNLTSAVEGEIIVQKADGTVQDGIVGTGNKIIVKDSAGTMKAIYTVLIYGDANGDGNIYATDYRIIKNQIMNDKQLLFDIYEKAADVNRDGNVYATDYRLIKNHIMEVSEISQK